MTPTLLRTTTLVTALLLAACGGSPNNESTAATAVPTAPKPDAALLQRLAQLKQSVEYAEDISAIKKLQKSYSYNLDKGLWTDLAEYFADDARANYPAGIYKGKESIRQHLYRNVGGVEIGQVGLGDNRLYNHMNIQPVVNLDAGGTTGRGRWRAMAMLGSYGSPSGTWVEGVYNMRYVKDNSVWKIQDLDYHSGFGASYATGWGATTETPSGSGGVRNLPHPADEARNMACEGFPQSCVAPFLYGNLGTTEDGSIWQSSTVPALPANTDYAALTGELLQRAQVLRDEQQIENLQRIYGFYIDRAMWDKAAALFASNGTIEYGQQGVFKGAQRVREFMGSWGPQGLHDGWLNDHVQLQTLATVAPNGLTARARSREWNMLGDQAISGSGKWEEGTFENSYVKQNGVWKFASVHYFPTFITDYDKGWTQDAQPAPAVMADLPPDAPPSEVYEIFPKAYVPAFHYPNPVSGNAITYPQVGSPSAQSIAATEFKPAPFEAAPVADLAVGIARAELLIQRAKDHNEIENLENAYGYYLDKNLWNDLADLFAIDGSMELAQRGVYKGRERVRSMLFSTFGAEGPSEGRLGNHIHMQPVITLNDDGTTALVRSRMMQQLSFGGRPSMGAAVYENEVVKEDGKWKYASTHAFNTWSAGYIGGWMKTVQGRVPGPSETLPPDSGPSFEFAMFPNVYDFPFHYDSAQ